MEIEQYSMKSPVDKERNEEIKDFLKFKENDITIYPNIRNQIKAVISGSFIALIA